MHRQFLIPGIKISDHHIRNVARSTAGASEATPNCTCMYVSHIHGHLRDQLDLPMELTTMDRRKAYPVGYLRASFQVRDVPKFAATECYVALFTPFCTFDALPDVCCTTSSIGSTAVSHAALHTIRIKVYMESKSNLSPSLNSAPSEHYPTQE